MKRDIPNEADWGDWNSDLDQRHAHEIYFGKSNEEMQGRFVTAPVAAAGELEFMPAIPFRYYMLGFRDSVLSGKHDEVEAANAASSFMRLVLQRLRSSKGDILLVMPLLMPALEQVAEKQDAFGADFEIFGDFRELLQEIKSETPKHS